MFRHSGSVAFIKHFQRNSVNFVNYSTSNAATTINKQDYYKNKGEAQGRAENNTKPAGWDEALPFESIPGPKPIPVLGNVFRFFPVVGKYHGLDFLDLHKRLHEEYGDIAALRKFANGINLVVLFAPQDIEYLCRNEGIWPTRTSLPGFDYYRRKMRKNIFQGIIGTITSKGKEWFDFRSTVNPIMMQPRSTEQYVDKIDEITTEFIGNMRYFTNKNPEGEMPEDFLNELNKWSLESIAVSAFDTRLGCLNRNLAPDSETQKFINNVTEFFDLIYEIEILPNLWFLYNTPTWKRYVEIMDFLTNTILKHIERAKAEDTSNKTDQELSIFQRLLKIDDKIALAMAIDMMQAGVDTTSKTAAAALYYLAKNPQAQAILREESRKLLPNSDSPFTKDTLKKASYVKAVIKETQRLTPTAVGNIRTTLKDLVIRGYRVPKGTDVMGGNLVMSRQQRYFPRSDEFLPERWLRSTTDELSHKNVNPFVSMPFGFGPRSCLGKRIALMELEIILTKISRNFEFSWPHEDMTFRTTFLHGIGKPLKLHVKEINE